jgi:hypothetical protein
MQPGLALLAPSHGGVPESIANAAQHAPTPAPAPSPRGSMADGASMLPVRSSAVMEALQRHSSRSGGAPVQWVPRALPPPLPPTEQPLLARLRQGAAAARERVASALRAATGDAESSASQQRDADAAPLLPTGIRSDAPVRSLSAGDMLDRAFDAIERGRSRSGSARGSSTSSTQ